MNVDDFAQVPDLDSQLLLNSSSAASGLLRNSSDERNLYSRQNNDMNPNIFNQYNQAPYMPQEVDPSSLRGLPQHFMQGVTDMTGGPFPLAGAAHPVNLFTPVVHQQVPAAGAPNDKPTAAQAAAGRLQRASARQAAKAAQQQKRQAQARAVAASKGAGSSGKRKKDEEDVVEEEDEEDSDDDDESDGDATVPSGGDKQPKPHEIAKTKYNHIEDEKERKRLKRLLRNRVSAQQARERKKAYMSTLEDERRGIQTKMAEMEAKINTLERENFMLRQVVKNATQGKTGTGKVGISATMGTDESRAVPTH